MKRKMTAALLTIILAALAACGSAWVEAGCDQVEQELARCLPNRYRTDSSVPGTEICRCLCSRRSAPHWIPKGGLDCM